MTALSQFEFKYCCDWCSLKYNQNPGWLYVKWRWHFCEPNAEEGNASGLAVFKNPGQNEKEVVTSFKVKHP